MATKLLKPLIGTVKTRPVVPVLPRRSLSRSYSRRSAPHAVVRLNTISFSLEPRPKMSIISEVAVPVPGHWRCRTTCRLR